MRTSLRRMFSLGVVVLFIAQHNSNAQTITSTTSGGRWNAASTWVGGVVPSSGNDVVIAGLVKFENGDGSCRNLTVNSGGTLNNATDYYANERILTVNGNVTNNGTIANYGNQPLVLRIKGNVINNGTWTPRRAELNGTGTQTLTAGATNGFNSNITVDTIAKPSIAAGSNLIFTATFDLGKRTLDMKSYSLTFVGEGTLLTNGTVVSAKDITGLPAYSIYGTPNYPSMYNITYSGSVNIHNRIQINSLVTFSGTTTVTDTLETISDYYANERILTIIGSLTNNGIMRGGRNPLALNVSGDITNNGTWTFTRTELSGTSNQTLTLAPNKLFESAFKVTDFLGMIVAGSNLAMTSWFDLRKCTLDMKNYSLTLQGSGATVYNGLVVNTKDIVGRTVGGANPNVDNITYDGNPTIKGRFRINTLVTFKGNVTIADTIESYYYYADPEKVLKIVGNITNNGIIRNYGNGLALNVTGNVTNNGTWIHKRTDLSGTSNQVITLNPSAKFESPFRVTDSLGMVVAGSNLVFTSSFDLNKTVLDMKSFNLTLVSDGAGITNGIVINTKDVNGVPSYNIYGTPLYPMMNNITYDGSIYLKGRIQINYSATLKGNVTVVDTVESISDYYANARTLSVIGNITNTGIMRGGRNPF
ncbi:MAG: hypothetical protein NTZ35_05500, partial [Ignavibacteriales bacterium]|nr:hypothetical protein [Ignavibacteriales bacterium]